MKDTGLLPVSPRSTVIVQSVRTLRNAIMQGNLKPGQKLIEAGLCEDLGISRASLREALRVLETERLIQLIPNRGPFVAKLDVQTVEDIHDVWALLTGEIVYRFTETAIVEDVATLDARRRAIRQAANEHNTPEQRVQTDLFFNYIATKCDNRILSDMIESLVSRINFLRSQSLLLEGWALLCAEEISDILDAIRSNQQSAARAATKRHITSACAAAKQVIMLTASADT